MIGLIGIKKDIDIKIREKFSIENNISYKLKALFSEFKEVIILSTCNRTEIYINYEKEDEHVVINKVFKLLDWDINYREFIFFEKGDRAIAHLFKVSCGYHSKIFGEDQILGQVRNSYLLASKLGTAKKELGRLFQSAIACGKKFRSESKLYEIPVSSPSIVVNELVKNECNDVLVIGYGDVGKLVMKYLLQFEFNNIYLAIRDIKKAEDLYDDRVKVVNIEEKNLYIPLVQGLVSCTSAPYPIVKKSDINNRTTKLECFDMSVPRDLEEGVEKIPKVNVYNIDDISRIDDINKELRVKRMKSFNYIIDNSINEYLQWYKLRSISNDIVDIKKTCDAIYKKRLNTYNNKRKNKGDEKLVERLIKSTSDAYINRAIEVLKEEKLRGCEEECLRIIKKIFIEKD